MISPFSGGCKTGGRFPLLYHEAPRTARGKAEGRRSGDRLDRRLGEKTPPRAFFAAGAVFFLIENRGVPLIRHGLTAATPSPKRGEGFGAIPGRSAPLSGQAKGLPLLAAGAAAPGGPTPKAGIRQSLSRRGKTFGATPRLGEGCPFITNTGVPDEQNLLHIGLELFS